MDMGGPGKVRAGVSFDASLLDVLDRHVGRLVEYRVDRSEIVNAILADYFQSHGSSEAVWAVIGKKRVRERK